MKKRYWIVALAGLVGLVALIFFMQGDGKDEGLAAGQVMRVAAVDVGDLELTVSADGVVQPINKVEIKSKASGLIEELNFEEGEAVEEGDLLIALDQTTTRNDYEQAKAELEVAQASAQQQENNLHRSLELFEKKLLSEQDRDQAHVDHVRAQSTLVKAKAALSSADARLRDTRIRAPITGIILTKDVEMGQIIASGVSNVGGGTLLATVADMAEVYVEASVDEVDIGSVTVGQRVEVVADAYPEETFLGKVVRIAPLGLTQQNVTVFTVVIQVPNRGKKLKAGMSASVEIEVFRRRQVLRVPNEALKDPRSEQGRVLAALLSPQGDSMDSTRGNETMGPRMSGEEMRERFASASPEEREKMRVEFRERMQNLSPEEREKMRAEFRERMQNLSPEERQRLVEMRGRQEGGGRSEEGSRRTAQVQVEKRIKRRIVLVKEGEDYVPRFVTVGVSNFDYTEVIAGLEESDQVLITTVSRAILSIQEFNERLRSRTGMGGMGGRRPR
jgi:HlyD family secretion protein